jgi:glucose/arabinose dehydrogenase
LGLAFHPGFETNGYFYININPSGGANRTEIQRYQAQGDPKTSTAADATSRKLILTYPQPYENHNGGWLGFGPDGYLYIASGDGGSGDDPGNRAQNRSSLLGKILRIDVNVDEDATEPYAIPEGNPFKGHATYAEEIWAFGLRNPWRCSFDREAGHLWIGDVGQGSREEIDVNPSGVGGLNFGWRPREGLIQNPAFPGESPVTTATDPIFNYGRTLGFSVTGGYVYRGQRVPELLGKYIFGDYGSERFWLTTLDESQTNGSTIEITTDINPGRTAVTSISSFGEDSEGELYVCELNDTNGKIFRILGEGPAAASIREVSRVGQDLVLSFDAIAGQQYVVEASGFLGAESDWTEVMTLESVASNREVTVTNAVTGEARYFRILSEQ